ncbi:uncharacterized protein LOC113360664 [Papaver somniferum]|uniref:uncharacterized protein LOC113360664 n=1 Tax=Papaver somniferum TaxID=3469 RepID=UPI000E6FBE09|nr:uncharacterized protein LOC113360664 [Papaver somniferum]
MSGEAAAVADNLLVSITGVVNLWLAGKCPESLGEFIGSAPLTPLLKPGGGIRPIAVGRVWRRLVSKVAAFSVGKYMSSYLGDYNLVLECLMVERAFYMLSQLIKEVRLHCPGISRWVEFCYLQPTKLYYDQYILSSTLGVQQGDPLGPLMFTLTLHPLVKFIASQCKLDLQAWYLDNGTIIGDTLEVAKALHIIETEGPGRGLHLNVKKTEVFWPSIDPRSTADGVFPRDIGRPTNGVELLGGPVSLDLNFISDMMLTRVNKNVQLMAAIKKLKDPQSKMLLLRNCTCVSRLYFAMRTTNPASLQPASEIFDDHLLKYLRLLITGDGADFGPLQQRSATLPIKDGGLGIYTMDDTRNYCYLASQSQTASVQKIILGKLSSTNKFSAYQMALQNFIQCLGPRQFRVVLCNRLGIPLFVENVDIFYKASVHVRKEANLGILTDDGKDLRPADILVLNWDNG